MKIKTQKLRELLGSEEAVQRFIDLFRQQLPAYLESLRKASVQADWETLSLSAHALKSQCRYLGLEDAANYLEQLEHQPDQPLDETLLNEMAAL